MSVSGAAHLELQKMHPLNESVSSCADAKNFEAADKVLVGKDGQPYIISDGVPMTLNRDSRGNFELVDPKGNLYYLTPDQGTYVVCSAQRLHECLPSDQTLCSRPHRQQL